ncbi:MAG: phage shock protein E [Gammaproteobacteria bacterium]|nr:MAG: phage shock protein E [Gammaproteobacteria bacterium]TND04274.1 MAG: phage shock protein E [Gammaproteobacteria bacterium]
MSNLKVRRVSRFHAQLTGIILVTLLTVGSAIADAIPTVSAAALLERINANNAPLILDVRREDEFMAAHITGAVNIPHTELKNRLTELARYRNAPVVIHCETGRRAAQGASVLLDAGFSKISYLEGHMAGWRSGGFPLEELPNH